MLPATLRPSLHQGARYRSGGDNAHMQPATQNFTDDPRPQPPEAPLPSDCCDSGCDPCVNDTYAEELAHYRQALAAWLDRHPEASP